MKYKLLLLALPVIAILVSVTYYSRSSSKTTVDGKWKLVWSDEFDREDGTSVDSSKWAYDIGGHGWGNNEEQYYTSGTNNCYIKDKQLVIEAKKENFSSNKFTSARIKTQGIFEFMYGKIEIRAKLPFGQGIWPAFWMLGSDIDTVNWPDCGEIDIMENIGKEPKIVHGTAHGPGYNGSMGIGNLYTLDHDFSADYHVFSVEWTKDKIEWFVDGIKYHSLTPKNIFRNKWAFNKKFFIILNLAVGGNWPGYTDETTKFPQKYLIDYIRVYK